MVKSEVLPKARKTKSNEPGANSGADVSTRRARRRAALRCDAAAVKLKLKLKLELKLKLTGTP